MGIIYFIRHAESIVNVNREFSYKLVDKGLTEKGILQATQLAEFLRNTDFSYLFSSPMKRTRETSDIIVRTKGITEPYTIIEDIREANQEFSNLPDEDVNKIFGIITKQGHANKVKIDGKLAIQIKF